MRAGRRRRRGGPGGDHQVGELFGGDVRLLADLAVDVADRCILFGGENAAVVDEGEHGGVVVAFGDRVRGEQASDGDVEAEFFGDLAAAVASGDSPRRASLTPPGISHHLRPAGFTTRTRSWLRSSKKSTPADGMAIG